MCVCPYLVETQVNNVCVYLPGGDLGKQCVSLPCGDSGKQCVCLYILISVYPRFKELLIILRVVLGNTKEPCSICMNYYQFLHTVKLREMGVTELNSPQRVQPHLHCYIGLLLLPRVLDWLLAAKT